MASLDWSQCPAVESIPGKVSGAWVFRGTRMPVQTVFENLEAGMSVEEITEVFDVTPEEVKAVLHFASESLAKAPPLGRSRSCSITVPRNRLPVVLPATKSNMRGGSAGMRWKTAH